MGLIVRSSRIHAAGCYTTAAIAKGTHVVEYTGPIIEKDEADLRYAGRTITYLFGIGDGSRVIDGHGTAMFVNHSCDANCETEEIDDHVWIAAIRDIAAGEELCYDYRLYDGDDADLPCNCGTKRCRGSMYSPEELRRRKREKIGIGEPVPRKREWSQKEASADRKSTDRRAVPRKTERKSGSNPMTNRTTVYSGGRSGSRRPRRSGTL